MRDLNNLLLRHTLQVALESLMPNPDQAFQDSQLQLAPTRKTEDLRRRTDFSGDGWIKPDRLPFGQKTAFLA